MKTKNLNSIVLFALIFCLTSFVHSQSKVKAQKEKVKTEAVESQSDIMTFLKSSRSHTILVKAIEASGLSEKLAGEGAYTLFAPTDDAFGKLPEGTLKSLLKPENKEKLKAILAYHIIPGNFNSAEIVKAIENNNGESDFRTLNEKSISAYTKDGILVLTGVDGKDSEVEISDKQQTNGYVHVVNAVMLANE